MTSDRRVSSKHPADRPAPLATALILDNEPSVRTIVARTLMRARVACQLVADNDAALDAILSACKASASLDVLHQDFQPSHQRGGRDDAATPRFAQVACVRIGPEGEGDARGDADCRRLQASTSTPDRARFHRCSESCRSRHGPTTCTCCTPTCSTAMRAGCARRWTRHGTPARGRPPEQARIKTPMFRGTVRMALALADRWSATAVLARANYQKGSRPNCPAQGHEVHRSTHIPLKTHRVSKTTALGAPSGRRAPSPAPSQPRHTPCTFSGMPAGTPPLPGEKMQPTQTSLNGANLHRCPRSPGAQHPRRLTSPPRRSHHPAGYAVRMSTPAHASHTLACGLSASPSAAPATTPTPASPACHRSWSPPTSTRR